MIKLYVFMVPNILVNKFISEIYPFTPEEVYTNRERVDFKYLSKNRNLDWTYQLIKQFENDWDWESLDQNISVFKKLTLGLLFPERIRLQECDCFFQMNFCEREDCHHNWKKFLEASSLEDDFPEIFWRMRILLESDAIDAEMIKSYYNSDNPDEVIKLELELQ